jgi:hypothetical protein
MGLRKQRMVSGGVPAMPCSAGDIGATPAEKSISRLDTNGGTNWSTVTTHGHSQPHARFFTPANLKVARTSDGDGRFFSARQASSNLANTTSDTSAAWQGPRSSSCSGRTTPSFRVPVRYPSVTFLDSHPERASTDLSAVVGVADFIFV